SAVQALSCKVSTTKVKVDWSWAATTPTRTAAARSGAVAVNRYSYQSVTGSIASESLSEITAPSASSQVIRNRTCPAASSRNRAKNLYCEPAVTSGVRVTVKPDSADVVA